MPNAVSDTGEKPLFRAVQGLVTFKGIAEMVKGRPDPKECLTSLGIAESIQTVTGFIPIIYDLHDVKLFCSYKKVRGRSSGEGVQVAKKGDEAEKGPLGSAPEGIMWRSPVRKVEGMTSPCDVCIQECSVTLVSAALEVVTSDADDEDSNSDEDKYLYKREEDFWSKRIPKCMNLNPNGNRTVANQSSLSDSFVLPTINDPLSPPSGEGVYPTFKKSRTAGGRLDHFSQGPKRSNGIPLSKSCPTLSRRKGRRKKTTADASDEFAEEIDRKSMSYNIGSELRKELESSSQNNLRQKKRGKGKKVISTQNHSFEHDHCNSTSNLILPDIFTSGASDKDQEEISNSSNAKRSINDAKLTNSHKTSSRSRSPQRHESDRHLPVMFEVDHSDTSHEMDFSPWEGRSPPIRGSDEEVDMS
ncbi:hypothetical protein HOLleu_08590 [Holothuria leucospilota]|uniref:Uncharacterized protein n=1 Tax=Holothuria leucospilota TaxID=206669 RepID=A0A9Q1CHN8_HOLLE|nr:hypothetical protein HOLleu_08590 [Holothuria leucospilota]